ncbi:hypothetical protein LPTSP3_g38360 [Leptospira kobayashii]|uniref:Uncharacterized protein n=1 Tax=Leptospira kobayashii TaxID=1917830 RepID=A0ABN6KLY3_9LEPT|nr:hypothetical protein [Leptospira kobayashii]BDA80906.1 hypothetical protein LPTSP3_g38360 [Leptospira kobayashii]
MNHDHGWNFQGEVSLEKGFPFHSKLKDWIGEYTNLPEGLSISIFESRCEEANCPVEETKLSWNTEKGEDSLRIGRSKEKISKQDFYLAWKKKTSN